MNSIIFATDSYKTSHYKQYPPNTQKIYSYIESRGGRYGETVMFGITMFIEKYLRNPITQNDIDLANEIYSMHGVPFNKEGWEYILKKYNGFLPLLIKAIPEGNLIPVNNVLVTVVNTDEKCYWLTGYIETALLRSIWYPTTVATISFNCKRIIYDYLLATSDDPDGQIMFKLHDFGSRGVSSGESAEIGGVAHLVNFMGTDTVEALIAARKYYSEPMAAYSIPAAEHSTITSWGKDNEIDAYRNMLKQFAKPNSLVAVVSDSYDLFNAVNNIWGDSLKEDVINSGATVIIRPDSGNPTVIPVEVIKQLGEKFGYTINSKGYKVLNNVRVIHGDGITDESIPKILKNVMQSGYSIDNIAFGMGGGLLQQVNRDTQKFAMKCSAIQINDKWYDVYKAPITDQSKSSKRGRLALIREMGYFETVSYDSNQWRDELKEVYKMTKYQNTPSIFTDTLKDIRNRNNSYFY